MALKQALIDLATVLIVKALTILQTKVEAGSLDALIDEIVNGMVTDITTSE